MSPGGGALDAMGCVAVQGVEHVMGVLTTSAACAVCTRCAHPAIAYVIKDQHTYQYVAVSQQPVAHTTSGEA